MVNTIWQWITENFGLIMIIALVTLFFVFKLVRWVEMVKDAAQESRLADKPDVSPADRVRKLNDTSKR